MTHDFEQRLRAADPAPRDVESSRTPRARALLEQTMSESNTSLRPSPTSPAPNRRLLFAVAAVAIVVAGLVGVAITGGDDDTATRGETLALSVDDAGGALNSCLQLSAEMLAPVDLAFDGTVTALDGTTATLDVARWYKGGTAETVTVENTLAGQPALIDGVEFAVGGRYLVTATGGTVNACGMSGAHSPELEALFADAFDG